MHSTSEDINVNDKNNDYIHCSLNLKKGANTTVYTVEEYQKIAVLENDVIGW